MLNTVSSSLFDPAGYVELYVKEDSNAGPTRRRVSRIATLDGGAVFNDGGFTEADRKIEIAWRSNSQSADDAIARLVRTYSRLTVATRDGVFLASAESFIPGTPESKLSLLVVSKLSA